MKKFKSFDIETNTDLAFHPHFLTNCLSTCMSSDLLSSAFIAQALALSIYAKTLGADRVTVWRAIKRFEERRDLKDRHRSGRPRDKRTPACIKSVHEKIRQNPRRSMRKMAKEGSVFSTTMRRIIHNDLKMFPFRLERKQFLTALTKEKSLRRSRMLLREVNTQTDEVVFSDEKMFTIEQSWNRKNDLIIAKTAQDIPKSVKAVTRRQRPASLMIWAAVSRTWKSPLIFVPKGCKINSQVYVILAPMFIRA